MLGIIYFLIALSIIVIVHEFGHLYFAKKFGVKCFEFSIGMGPLVKHFYTDKQGTKYNLRAIPLGGYVAMAGEDDNSLNEGVKDEEKLNNKTPIQRIIILVAGAGMNFILGFVLLFLVVFIGGYQTPSTTSNSVNIAINETVDLPIANSGIENGDEITSINGIKTNNAIDIQRELNKESESFNIVYNDISDLNKEKTTSITPTQISCDDKAIGVIVSSDTKRFDLIYSLKHATQQFKNMFLTIFVSFKMLIDGTAGVKDLAGPIGIAAISGSVVTLGFSAMFYFISFLSINIGVVNLLPIPALDGGRILTSFIELITRKKIPEKVENYIVMFGVFLLLALFVVVTFSDIMRTFTNSGYTMELTTPEVCLFDGSNKHLNLGVDYDYKKKDHKDEEVNINIKVSDGIINKVGDTEVNKQSYTIKTTRDNLEDGLIYYDLVISPNNDSKSLFNVIISITNANGHEVDKMIYAYNR
ncbi:MAG: RIP metalloprotease RseP [Mycoplasmatales bacterium]